MHVHGRCRHPWPGRIVFQIAVQRPACPSDEPLAVRVTMPDSRDTERAVFNGIT